MGNSSMEDTKLRFIGSGSINPMKFIASFILAIGFSVVGSAFAEKLTLGESVKRGLAQGLEIQKAQAERRQAEDEYSLAEAELFPTIYAKGSVGSTKYSSSKTSSSLSGNVESYQAGLVISQPLYKGGTTFAGLSAAKLGRKKAEQAIFSKRQTYVYDVVAGYYSMAEQQMLLDLARENRKNLKAYAEVTARYARIGRSKNIDRLQSESNYHLSEAQVLEAESSFEKSRQDLARLLGFEDDQQLQVETALKAQPVDTGTLDQLYQKAGENNPEIAELAYQVEYIRKTNRVKMASHYPELTLDGTWGFDSRDKPSWFEKESETSSVFLNLKIPLFSGLSSWSQSSYNNDELLKAERDLAIAKRDLRRDLAQSVSTMARQFERLKLTQVSAESSRKAMNAALRDYRNGLLSSTDVLNIQRTGYEADKTHTQAQYSYLEEVLKLRFNLGTDLEKTYGSL